MKRLKQILVARFRRWLYLLFIGMRRGECAYTHYGRHGRLIEIASGKPANNHYFINRRIVRNAIKDYRVWWSEAEKADG